MISDYKNIDFGEKGICKGIYYGQNERVDELNDRIKTRHFPDVELPPNFDPRPVSTKFCLYPTFIRNPDGSATKKSISMVPSGGISINDDKTYQKVVYNPGTDRGPPITFLKNIDIENQLRKEYLPTKIVNTTTIYSNEKSIPSQTYNTYIPNYLANPYINDSSQKIGGNKFNNFTKIQLRNIS